MKRVFIIVTVLAGLLLFACSKDNHTEVKTGTLVVINRSSAIAYVKIDSGDLHQIAANGSRTYVIDTGKIAGNRATASLAIHYYGDYLQDKTENISIINGTTVNYYLDADCGQLRINNNCNCPVSVFFSGDSLFTIDNNGYAVYKYKPEDGLSTLVTYSYNGIYVFPITRSTTIYTDFTTPININPNGGALSIINDSNGLVEHLYMRSTSTNTWGPDLLTQYLYPGNTLTLTIGAGNYDIKLIDLYEAEHFIHDERINANQTSTVTYDGL